MKFDRHPGRFDTLEEGCKYAFVQVVRQRAPSAFLGKSALRGSGDRRSFIGHLLPDTLYHYELEGVQIIPPMPNRSWNKVSSAELSYQKRRYLTRLIEATFVTELTKNDIQLLDMFQTAHDCVLPGGLRENWTLTFKAQCLPLFNFKGWVMPGSEAPVTA